MIHQTERVDLSAAHLSLNQPMFNDLAKHNYQITVANLAINHEYL